jgi:phage replication O-like protein O
MASPQVEDGYLKIANDIIDALMKLNLSKYEWRVLLAIIRKTYGYNKKRDWITLSQFSKATGIRDRRNIHRALKKLSSKQTIVVVQADDRNRVMYGFQKDYEKWVVSSKETTRGQSVVQRDDKVSSKETHTKDNIQKTTYIVCPHQKIQDLYHEILPELRQVRIWGDARKKFLKARWVESKKRQTLGWWRGYFEYVKKSDFLMGRKSDFQADLEWLIRPANFIKVIEGKYHR